MILYMNVYITEDRNLWPRYQLPTHSRLDVFKYALASLAVVPFSKVIIHAPLAEEFAGQEEGLLNYARQLFKDTELTFDFKRSTTLDEWKVASKEVEDHPDNLVWLFCNDDHIFLDYNLDMINEITELLSKEEEPLSVCYPSHWHEAITCCCSPSLPPPVKTGNFAVTRWNVHDSFQIMRKEVFLSYWKLPIGLLDLRRTDEMSHFFEQDLKVYIPLREMCRHFDGYAHSADRLHYYPPLAIPPGFFENDIKILYTSDEKRDGWVLVSPMHQTLRVADPTNGVDVRCMLEDLPLFWLSRISKMETDYPFARHHLLQQRNHLIEFICQHMHLIIRGPCYGQYPYDNALRLPLDWFEVAMRRS